MADYSTNLVKVTSSQAGKEIVINGNDDIFSNSGFCGRDWTTTSATTWKYFGGRIFINGNPVSVSNGQLSLTSNTTNYIQLSISSLNNTVTVTTTTTGFIAGYIPLYTAVIDGNGNLTDYTDYRSLRLNSTNYCSYTDITINGNTTLSAIQARADYIKLTQGSAVANFDLIVPNIPFNIVIRNSTSYNATVKTPTPTTTATISTGNIVSYIVCDGLDNIYKGNELATVFNDNTDLVQNSSDTSKKVRLSAANVTTSSTVTLTVPSSSTTIMGHNTTDNVTNKKIYLATTGAGCTFADNSDPTKELKLNLSGITGSTVRNVTIPNKSGTVAYLDDVLGTNSGVGADHLYEDATAHSGLSYAYKAGKIRTGIVITEIAAGSITVSASTTNYVYYDPGSTAVATNTSSFPTGCIPMALVTAGSATITASTDKRAWLVDYQYNQELINWRQTYKNATQSGTITIDLSLGNVHEIILSGNITSGISITNAPSTKSSTITVLLKQNGTGGWTISGISSSFKWSNGVVPVFTTAANAVDILTLTSIDGTTWYGFLSGKDMK